MLKRLSSLDMFYGIEADRILSRYNYYLEHRNSYESLQSLEEFFENFVKASPKERSKECWEEVWKVFLYLYKLSVKEKEKNKK